MNSDYARQRGRRVDRSPSIRARFERKPRGLRRRAGFRPGVVGLGASYRTQPQATRSRCISLRAPVVGARSPQRPGRATIRLSSGKACGSARSLAGEGALAGGAAQVPSRPPTGRDMNCGLRTVIARTTANEGSVSQSAQNAGSVKRATAQQTTPTQITFTKRSRDPRGYARQRSAPARPSRSPRSSLLSPWHRAPASFESLAGEGLTPGYPARPIYHTHVRRRPRRVPLSPAGSARFQAPKGEGRSHLAHPAT